MKRNLITFSALTALLSAFFVLFSHAYASKEEKGRPAQSAVTLNIAYTCNTWGQLQPCPS